MLYKSIVNPFTGKLQLVLDASLLKIKGTVDTVNDLPLTGNNENDCYIVKDTDRLYTWSIPESSGTIADWKDVGSTAEIDWSGITNKPTSPVADIDDAVSKKHTQNTDTGTNSNDFYIGNGFDTPKSISALISANPNRPVLRYNTVIDKWEVSHNGINFYQLAEGHDILTFTESGNLNAIEDVIYANSPTPIDITLPQSQGEARVIRFKNINTGDVTLKGFLSGGTLSWSNLTNSGQRAFMDIACSSDGTKIAVVVQNGYIYTSTDSGATWTERTSAGSRFWSSVCMSADGNTIYATGAFLGIYKSINGGTDWSTIATPLASVQWRRIRCSSDGSVVAISGQRSSHVPVFTSVNGGTSWTQHTSVGSGGENFRALTISANGQVILVAATNQNPRITVNGGSTWTEKTGAGARPWYNADCSDDGSIIALVANSNNYVYTSSDTGNTWNERTGSPQRNWEGVAVNSDGSSIAASVGYFAGGTDYIYLSADEGATWEKQEDAGASQWNNVEFSSDGSLIYGIRYNDWIVKGSSTPGERDKIDCQEEQVLKPGDSLLIIDSVICEWHILGFYKNINDVIENSHIQNTDKYLTTDVTKLKYVDGNRTDSYTPNGSITKPFKTITDALATASSGDLIKIITTTYTEDLSVPSGVSLEGCGGNNVTINGDVSFVSGIPITLRNIQFTGNTKTVTLTSVACSFLDCFISSSLVLAGTAAIQAWNTHIVSSTGVIPLTMNSTGKCQLVMSTIASTGDVPAISQTSGTIILNTVLVSASRVVNPVIESTGGTIALIAGQVINNLGGNAIDVSSNNATSTNPNMIANIIAVGNVVCGDKTTMVEGIQFISVGSLSGTALIYRPASKIDNDSSVLGATVKDALETLDSSQITIDDVKADVDIADAITKKHEQNTDISIDLTDSDLVNLSAKGLKKSFIAGEDLSFGAVCYLHSDGKLRKASADDETTSGAIAIVLESILTDATGECLLLGYIRNDSWSFTIGNYIYLSKVNGEFTDVTPEIEDDKMVQSLGIVAATNIIYFIPNLVQLKLKVDEPLPIERGGTGADNRQDAINFLTDVENVSDGYVLMKDSVTGNAIFKENSPVLNCIVSIPSGEWKKITSMEYNESTGEIRVNYES